MLPRPLRSAVALVLPLALVSLACGRGGGAGDPWRAADEFVRAMNRGVVMMDQYDYEAAAAALRQAVELEPESLEARFALALATFNVQEEGNVERATAMLDEVLAADPEHLGALYFRATLHMDAGEPETAVGFLEKVVAREPHDACAWYLLGRARRHADRPAKEVLLRAIAEDPHLASAYYDLFQLELREGNQEAADRYVKLFETLRENPLAAKMEVPKYRQMGPLAVVRPLAARGGAIEEAEIAFGEAREAFGGFPGRKSDPSAGPPSVGELLATLWRSLGAPQVLADVDEDGDLDLALLAQHSAAAGSPYLALLQNRGNATFVDATADSGLAAAESPLAVAAGDYDNDGHVDLFVLCATVCRLFRGNGDGTFSDASAMLGELGRWPLGPDVSAIFLDADHDADLDLYICNSSIPNQLLRNNADGTFTDVAGELGLALAGAVSILAAPADLDDDRDTDLVVFHRDAPISFFANDLLEGWRGFDPLGEPVVAGNGGVVQDFDGDGRPDLLVFPEGNATFRLFANRGPGGFERSSAIEQTTQVLHRSARLGPPRIADVDLDGDLDVAVLAPDGRELHLLRNDGAGCFALRTLALPAPQGWEIAGFALGDFTGDGVIDVLRAEDGPPGPERTASSGRIVRSRLTLLPGRLTPPAHWLALTVTGKRNVSPSMRSPAFAFGTKVEVRTGLHSQTLVQTGQDGGLGQSWRPLVFGLAGAAQADYVALRWPDGVTQGEMGLAADAHHVIPELQRRRESCPVLFAWDGERFVFVGDFAGVGGLGYYGGPEGVVPPRPFELVRIDPAQLVPRDGRYELRVTEPMEEVAYFDRLELLAVDHPAGTTIWPDDRLFVAGDPPTQELLCVARPIFPVRAAGPEGEIDVERLRETDRRFAYAPPPDRRFVGYSLPHALVVEFGAEVGELDPARPTYLFSGASLEYPYSQTNVGAEQAGVRWTPPRVELRRADGTWETLVADAGAPAGLARTIAIDLTGKLPAAPCALRLATNLEIYYDRIFLGQDEGRGEVEVRAVPLARAELRRLGFPLEHSPDGHYPTVYSYDVIEASSCFRRLPGEYTRYGPVDELLAAVDDRFVVMACGDEIAIEFAAALLPEPAPGRTRTLILSSHAYCKGMDLYTDANDAVTPLPFGAMSAYPPPAGESFPATDGTLRWQAEYETRVVR
ncbi:MAG: FG-GAP-like repeat-containing protein [Planctomycetota bacterium]